MADFAQKGPKSCHISGKFVFSSLILTTSRKVQVIFCFPTDIDKESLVLTLTLISESVYGSQFFHGKLLQVLMS